MPAAGYAAETVAEVGALFGKEGLAGAAADSDVQALEDVACLVFLEHHLPPFAAQHPTPKVVEILTKTWRKMSPRARREALELNLDHQTLLLLRAAGVDSA